MANKLEKYLVYLRQFIKSPIKRVILYEAFSEMKERGLVEGIQSFLHKRSQYFFPGYNVNSGYGPIVSLKKYTEELNVILPQRLKPRVSIIIPMYNQLEYTYYCVRSIVESEKFTDYEIIIADDNSTENNEFLKKHLENIIIVKNEKNLGFLKNCNNAAKHAKGDYLVFLNNDTQVKKGWLTELLFVFDNFKDAGLVGSKLIYPDGSLQEAGGIIWQDGSGWNYGNQDKPEKPEYNYIRETDYISGASIMIKKSIWDELGGFDERYSPAYCEDSDLCFAVREKGYKVYYQPFSVVVHFEGKSHGTDVNKGIKKYQVINNQKLVEKWQDELKLKSKNGTNVFTERERTGKRKHVLVIDHNVPTIDKDAGSRTISNFVDSLLGLGYVVKFWVPNMYPPQEYVSVLQRKGVEVLHGDPFLSWHEPWKKYFKQNMDFFDAILFSRSSVCIPLMIYFKNNNFKGKTMYYGHDLGYLRLEQEILLNRDISLDLKSKILKAEEDFMYENADHSLVCGYEELTFLKRYISQPIHYVAPYFFEVEKDTAPFEERDGIMFIGGFAHTPNQDAIIWFLNEIYPRIHEKGIKMTIAGSNIPSFIFEYKQQFKLLNIVSNISVDNLNKLYSKSKISVIPLRLGAGVKGKTIEAMSKGIPIAGTFLAFEGIPKDDDFPYKGFNKAEEIAENILHLYSNKQCWEKLSQYGKDYVAANFNKDNMEQLFKKILD